MSNLMRCAAVAASMALLAGPRSVAAQDWQTLSQARQFSSEKALKVDVEYAAGRLNVKPGSASSLYRASLRYDADIFKHPVLAYSNGTLKVDLSEGTVHGRNMKAGKLDLELSPRVPLDLDVSFGAAEATLDLTGLMVQRAQIHTGASQTRMLISKPNPIACESLELEVGAAKFEAIGLGNLNAEKLKVSGGVGEVVLDFSGASKRDVSADIQMGLGSLTIRIPRGTALKVTKEGLLASFDSEGMVKRGNSFFSENWKTAEHHVTLGINAAFGSIKLEWLDQ